MPPQAWKKFPVSMHFIAGGEGEWSETMKSIVPWSSAAQSLELFRASRDGWGAFEQCAAILNRARRKIEGIVGARFRRNAQTFLFRAPDQWHGKPRRQVHNMNLRLEFTSKADEHFDCLGFGAGRTGTEPSLVFSGIRFCDLPRCPPPLRSVPATRNGQVTATAPFRQVSARPLVSPPSRTFPNPGHQMAARKHLNPNTPARPQRREARRNFRNNPAPKPHVHPGFLARRGALGFKSSDGGGRGNAVEWHINQCGDAARGRRARCRCKTFPIGAARLVDVDVRVHQAGHNHRISSLIHIRAGGKIVMAAHLAVIFPFRR